MNLNAIFRQQALDKLNSPDNLNELLTVTSPKSWLALGAVALMMGAAMLWGFTATLETSVAGSGVITEGEDGALEVTLYVSLADAKRLRPGMIARISPNTVRREEFGMLEAAVISVDQLPSTHAEMFEVLGNDALVQSLSTSGSIIEVRLRLHEDDSTPSGFRWTSLEGPPMRLWDGTLCEGSIVILQQRPIDLLSVR